MDQFFRSSEAQRDPHAPAKNDRGQKQEGMNMRRTLTAAVLLASCATLPAFAGDDLMVGDTVPAIDVAHFFQGDAVNQFSKEGTYVLEFWATW